MSNKASLDGAKVAASVQIAGSSSDSDDCDTNSDDETPLTKLKTPAKQGKETTSTKKSRQASARKGNNGGGPNKSQNDTTTKSKPRRRRKALFTMPRPAKRGSNLDSSQSSTPAASASNNQSDGESNPDEDSSRGGSSPKPPTPIVPQLCAYTPFQLMLHELLEVLEKKDEDNYFAYPVTEDIAPGYSELIKQTMDFYTMRKKLDENVYENLEDFRADLVLICTNCAKYNAQDTVYHQAARRMLTLSTQICSEDVLCKLIRETMPFGRDIPSEKLGFEVDIEDEPLAKKAKPGVYEAISDGQTAAEILMAQKCKEARERLAARKLNVAHLGQNRDGTVTLKFLPPRVNDDSQELTTETSVSTEEPHQEPDRVIRLKDLVPPLAQGTPGLHPWVEDTRNLETPVQALDYGPFSSFAPTYDSTWATLSKADSNQLLRTYGDQSGVDYAKSLTHFVKDADNCLIRVVDGILDALTRGQHSKLVNTDRDIELIKESERNIFGTAAATPPQREPLSNSSPINFEELKTLSECGVDVSFLDDLEKSIVPAQDPVTDQHPISKELAENAKTLQQLQRVQLKRLSTPPAFTATDVKGPNETESQLAGKVSSNLAKLIYKTAPKDVISLKYVNELRSGEFTTTQEPRNVSDDVDMAVLNEFFKFQ